MKRKFRDPKRVEKDVKKEVKRDRKVIGADKADAVREAIKTPSAVRKAEARLPSAPLSSVDTKSAAKPLPKAGGEKSFSQAFREARRDGLKTFPWRGKTYTTQMKGEAPKRTVSAAKKPAAPANKPAPAPAKPSITPPKSLSASAPTYASSKPRPMLPGEAAKKFGSSRAVSMPDNRSPGRKYYDEVEKTKTIYRAKGGSIDGCAMRGKTKARKR